MTIKTYKWIRTGIQIVLGVSVALSAVLKIVLIPLIAVPAALIITIIMGQRVTGRIQDERLIQLSSKAARWSFSVFVILAAATGAVFVAAGRTYSTLWWAGLTLTFAVCFFMILYLCLYFIFTRNN